MTIKIYCLLLLSIVINFPTISFAKNDLPFVGTRSFNFFGGNGTGRTITIKANGETIINGAGTCWLTEYKGKYSDVLVVDPAENGYPSNGYLIKNNKIYSLENNKISKSCGRLGDGNSQDTFEGYGNEDEACVQELYDCGKECPKYTNNWKCK